MNRAGEERAAEASDAMNPKERVLDALLREAVGRERAPDLAVNVVARLAAADPGLVRLPRARARVFALGVALGSAAAALLTTYWPWHDNAPRTSRAVAWHVAEGCLQWQSAAHVEVARAGEHVLWPVDAGDRLRTCEDRGSVCDVSSLGRLRMTKDTEIEVAAMEWKAFAGGTALGAVTVAVVAGAIAWSGGGDVAEAKTGDRLELRAQAPNAMVAKVDELTRRVEDLQKDLLDERARGRDLEARVARAPIVGAAPEVATAATAEPVAKKTLAHAVTYPGMEAALSKVDWGVTGKCMHEMTMKLDEMFAAMEKGDDMPLEVIGEVQSLNAELIKQAGELMKAKVPGAGPNGVFTNPVVAANQMYAALSNAGMPLSTEQQDVLQRLSAQIAGEDDARRAAVKEEDFELAGVLGETELKDRFYAEARKLMTPQQEQALFPARLNGVAANLFSSGLVWAQFAKPVTVSDRGEFATQVSDALAKQIGLSEDATPDLRAAVNAWAKGLPDDAFGPADSLSGTGLGKVGQVRAAATRQLSLLRMLSGSVKLTAEQKRKLRGSRGVFVPTNK